MKQLILSLAIFAQGALLAGGGWTQPKGKGFFLVSQRVISGTNYYNSEGVIVASPSLSTFTSNIYGEYGITNRLTGVFYSPILTSVSRGEGIDATGKLFIEDQAAGLGDIDLGLQYQLLKGTWNLSASVVFGLPTGNHFAGTTGTLRLGDNEFNQLVKADLSRSFNHNLFGTIFAGFNNRTNGFSDEIHYGGEFGYSKNKLTAILKIYGRKSLFNEFRKDEYIPGIYSDNLEYFSFSPQVLYDITDHIGVLAEAGFAGMSRNIIASPSWTIGVYFNLK